MDKELLLIKQKQIETKIKDVRFYRNLHIYLTGSYTFICSYCVKEMIINKFDFDSSITYMPFALASVGICIYAGKTVKKKNYELKTLKEECLNLRNEMYNKEKTLLKK